MTICFVLVDLPPLPSLFWPNHFPTDLHSLLLAFGIPLRQVMASSIWFPFSSSRMDLDHPDGENSSVFTDLKHFLKYFPMKERFFKPPSPRFLGIVHDKPKYIADLAILSGCFWSADVEDENKMASLLSEVEVTLGPVEDLQLALRGQFLPLYEYNGDWGLVSLQLFYTRAYSSIILR